MISIRFLYQMRYGAQKSIYGCSRYRSRTQIVMSAHLMIKRMNTFPISTEIPAPLDNVWNIVSDIEKEPEYWHGTKS